MRKSPVIVLLAVQLLGNLKRGLPGYDLILSGRDDKYRTADFSEPVIGIDSVNGLFLRIFFGKVVFERLHHNFLHLTLLRVSNGAV